MPFDFDAYQKKCNGMTTEELNKEWDNYTRQIAGGSTSTATSILLSGITGGVSLIGLGFSAPRIHNARKKREIIQAGLDARGTTHHTHAKDVLIPMAMVGAAGAITVGLGVSGAELIPNSGGISHSAVDYLATHAAASVTVTYIKHKTRELAKTNEEEILEYGIDPPCKERYGPQLGPVIHQYSTFGHTDEHLGEQPVPLSIQAQMTQYSAPYQTSPVSPSSLSATSTSSSSALTMSMSASSLSTTSTSISSSSVLSALINPSSPDGDPELSPSLSDQNQNVRSLSLPSSNALHSIHRKQVARTQSENPKAFQTQNDHERPLLGPAIRAESDVACQAVLSDDQLDALVATLSDEGQMMLLMKLELELRSPAGSQPLHRTKAIHASHGRRPHIKDDDKRESWQITELLPIQLSDEPCDLDELAPALTPRHPSLPVRLTHATQQPPLPPRSPSLPVLPNSSDTPAVVSANADSTTTQILRKPLVTSPRQSYSAESRSMQPQRPQLEDQRKDSGWFSSGPTPAIPGDVLPRYNPPEFPAQTQDGSQSSLLFTHPTSPPPPPYYSPSPSTIGSSARKDYFTQNPATNNLVHNPVDLLSSKERQNSLGMLN